MSAESGSLALEVPARAIPIPASVSPEAQAYLARGPLQVGPSPRLDDIEGWHAMIAATDQMVLARLSGSGAASPEGFQVEELIIGGITVYEITPPGLRPGDRRVYLEPLGHVGD